MVMAKYSANINVMVRAAEKAARSLLRDFGEVEQLQVSKKGPADFVSAADIRAEEIIQKELSRARPDFGFLMEEKGLIEPKNSSNSRWIIDPLDGTTNFLHGIPHWAISIALEENNIIIAGVIYDPIKDELFWAEKGSGAFMSNKRLRVSGRRNIQDTVIAIATPNIGHEENIHSEFATQLASVIKAVTATRRLGAAALDLAYVAAGRFDGFWEMNLSPWDVAAGSIIIKEAGGYITDIDGMNNYIYGKSVVAANPNIQKDLRAMVNNK